jgi:hypothetical protein
LLSRASLSGADIFIMANDTLEKLELVRQIADRFKLDSAELRPCVAAMLAKDGRDIFSKFEHIAFMIAIDLARAGERPERISEILNDAHISSRANIRNAVQSAKDEKYKRWQCDSNTMRYELDQIRQYYCVGKSHCLWYAQHDGKWKKKFREEEDEKFEKYGWHHIISAYERGLYNVIRELERIHGAGTGGLIIASHDKLAFMVGCSRRHVGTLLSNLRDVYKLINYQVGDKTRQARTASKIQRIMPVPEPEPKWDNRLVEFEQYNHMGRID